MKKNRVFGIVVFIAAAFLVFFAFVYLGIGYDRIMAYIDVPTFAVLVFPTFGFLVMGYGVRSIAIALGVVLTASARDKSDAKVACDICSTGWKVVLASAVITMLIGCINMLSQGIDNPSVLSSGLAVALLCPFWGVIIATVFVVFGARANRALASFENTQDGCQIAKPTKILAGAMYFVLLTLTFLLSLASFICLFFQQDEVRKELQSNGEQYEQKD